MSSSGSASSRPPAPWLTALEARALVEFGASRLSSPLLRRSHRGDEHPVLVLPGFTADDRSTGALRQVLRDQGYWVHGWRLGRNLGPTPRVVEGLVERLGELHDRHGRPVSLIGWSLGGIYARELARGIPAMVRQVITLGSPFRMAGQDRSAATALYERLKPGFTADSPERLPESIRPSLEVPATAVYTRTDGIVRWWQCLESAGPMRENIEVRGSHSGLGYNPAVVYAVSDRLAQPEDGWRPFRPPRWLRRLYPAPDAWQQDRHQSSTEPVGS